MAPFFSAPRRVGFDDQTERSVQVDVQDIANSKRWLALLSSSDDAVIVADSHSNVIVANGAASRLFNHQFPTGAGVLEGQNAGSVLSLTLSSELDALFTESVNSGTDVESEITVQQAITRNLRARIVPIESGEYLILLHDRTELRRLERVRQDFVANVSHELRTPLTSVRAMAETLLDGALQDPDVSTRFLETIIRESDRLVRLSSDLLSLSRAEACDVRQAPVDLGMLIQDVIQRMTSQAQRSEITLLNYVRSPLIVLADYDDLAQVANNLLDNAISYTPRNGRVTVQAQDDLHSVTIEVADTGIGIASNDIARIFERFYRADKARSRASGGTGLGLSIVKHIVESHGGSVGVSSEYNKGSNFMFTLPKPASE